MKEKLFFLTLAILLSIPTVKPLLGPGYFPMHDDTQVGRVVAMRRSLAEGQFPVRWVADLGYGYGYPIFNFYGPLPYYVGAIGSLIGLSGLDATKFMMAIGMLLPAITMFLFLSRFGGTVAGLVGSLLLVYAPYHAVQLYVRGAVGELWTLGFYPLLAWGLLSRAVLIGGVGLSGVVLSHTLLGYATVLFVTIGLIVYWIYKVLRRQFHFSHFTSHISLLLLGLCLSAFFWLPAAFEMRFTDVAGQVGATSDFRDHFVCLPQLWNSEWGFGGSTFGCTDGMSFRLGKVHILLSFFSLTLLWFVKQAPGIKRIGWLGLVVTTGSIFLMLPVSSFLWEFSPYGAYLQYPWRFLATAVFGMSLLGAVGFGLDRSGAFSRLLAIFTIGAVLFINGKLFQPQYIIDRPATAYETNEELRWRVSKISDEYLPAGFRKPSSQDELPQGIIVDEARSFSLNLTSTSSGEVTIHKAYFPGWRYWVNGVLTEPIISNGLPILTISKGENVIKAHLINSKVQILGNIISLVSLFFVGVYIWAKNQR